MSLQRAFLATFGAALFSFGGAALAQNAPPPAIRLLDAIPGEGAGVTYIVVPGSDLVIPFTVDIGGPLELLLSPFRGEHGDAVSIQPSIDGIPAAAKDGRVIFTTSDGAVQSLRLKIPALSQPGKYSGTLTMLRDGKHQHTDRLVLTRAVVQRPATITADWKTPTVHERTFSFAHNPATFSLQVRNTSDEWRADGIFLRLLDVTAPAGTNFDAARNLKLTWNGQDAGDLWRSPPADGGTRSIAPSQQVEIGGQVRDLAPGEYTVKIGLGAANATVQGDQQPVTLKLFVRHGVELPLTVLILAILLSYVATKGLEAQRRRGAALAKVDEIRRGTRLQERSLMPAVAARALLDQAEARNKSFLDSLFGHDTTSALLAKAELLYRILERAELLRLRIESAPWTTMMMRHRARKRLSRTTGSINPERMDEKEATRLEAELAELEKWLDPKSSTALYLADFRGDIESLLAQAIPEALPVPKDLVLGLRSKIATRIGSNSPSTEDLEDMERAYVNLKILWERRGDREASQQLSDLLQQHPETTAEEFFKQADDVVWRKLETATFEFTLPRVNEVEPQHAHELIRFEVAPGDRSLGNNFLFKHGITYRWALYLQDRHGRRQFADETTTEPCIVQYAPRRGKLTGKVELTHEGKPASKHATLAPMTIVKSSDYSALSILRSADLAALLIAVLFATVTGLATYYFGDHDFGGISDYIALFVWGAGVDQTKNFIQQLGKASGTA